MPLVKIDTNTTELDYQQTTQLEGVEYVLRFQWMDREECWYLSIFDQDENPLATWIKVVVTWDLLRRRRVRDPRIPRGVLMAIDTSGRNQDIATPDELGKRVQLTYLTSDETSIAGAA